MIERAELEKLKEIINSSDNIVFFGGAGVSTASNIPDFRSAGGLYSDIQGMNIAPEEILSHRFFINHPKDFFDFYRSKMIYTDALPNEAHLALATLEKQGKLKGVVTQNIDGLHQAAGSEKVFELHGSVHRNYCMDCGQFYDLPYMMKQSGIPSCHLCGGIVKPDVVLYEEGLDEQTLEDSIQAISKAEVLIVGGTSLTVYPAAGLVTYYQGKNLILINKTVTAYDQKAHLVIYGNIAKVLKAGVSN